MHNHHDEFCFATFTFTIGLAAAAFMVVVLAAGV
jgi:hypothetical protein